MISSENQDQRGVIDDKVGFFIFVFMLISAGLIVGYLLWH